MLWSLRTAQNRPERAQSRSEPLRIAQSAPRAAQSRPERSLRAVRGTALGRPEPLRVAQSGRSGSPRARPCRAAPSEEPLRIARSVPRAAQSRSELLEKPIGELGVTCTLHIRRSVLLHLVPSSPCMYMHGFALVYKGRRSDSVRASLFLIPLRNRLQSFTFEICGCLHMRFSSFFDALVQTLGHF